MKKIQKTNRKVISITLAVIMCFSFCILTAISAYAAPIASVSTYQQLADALNDPNISYISITSDITLTSQLTISRNITIAASSTKTLYQANRLRHFILKGDNIILSFNNIILDGNNLFGGISCYATTTTTAATINNPNIKNCYNTSGAAIYTDVNLSISGGMFDSNNTSSVGGAIFSNGRGTTLNLIACTFANNNSTDNIGGAVLAANTMQDVNIFDCDFIGNSSTRGGAVTSFSKNLHVYNCRFKNNKTNSNGALFIEGNAIVENTIFDGNTAIVKNGGALSVSSGNTSVINCNFINNYSELNGGAIATYSLSALTVDADTTFTANSAGDGGYYMNSPADIALHNQQIKATVFTSPFYYAYNNCDINYIKGIQA